MRKACLVVIATVVGSACVWLMVPRSPPPGARADALYAAMRDGTYRQEVPAPPPWAAALAWAGVYRLADPQFLPLGWEDVPALLARADSTFPLQMFPCNFASSQAQSHCSEGMVALWLVEGRLSRRWKPKDGSNCGTLAFSR